MVGLFVVAGGVMAVAVPPPRLGGRRRRRVCWTAQRRGRAIGATEPPSPATTDPRREGPDADGPDAPEAGHAL